MKNLSKLLGIAIVGGGLMISLSAKADTYFRDSDRTVLRSYNTSTTTTTTTPGDTVTYYAPGTALPDTVTYTELPTSITTKLVAAPKGDEYVAVGRNYYLIDHDKRMVIDAERMDNDKDKD